MLGMSLALLRARGAQVPARGHLRPGSRRGVLRLPREKAAGGIADVGAIQAETDALAEIDDLLLRQAGVSAGGTRCFTGTALVDAATEHIAVDLCGPRMSLEHLLGRRRCSHDPPLGLVIPTMADDSTLLLADR
jgi:hypothetical protein